MCRFGNAKPGWSPTAWNQAKPRLFWSRCPPSNSSCPLSASKKCKTASAGPGRTGARISLRRCVIQDRPRSWLLQSKVLGAEELRQLMTGGSAEPAATPHPTRKRRKMSAAARQRMAEAQRKSWASAKKESGVAADTVNPAAKKPERKLSAAGRQRIIDAPKKRWAAVRAAAAKAK